MKERRINLCQSGSMSKEFKLPAGMSQLDYLWANFGGKTIAEDIENSNPNAIVTAEALKNYLQAHAGENGGVTSFDLKDNGSGTLVLRGLDQNGAQIALAQWDKADNLIAIERYDSTQYEIDRNIVEDAGIPLIVFTLKSGKKFYIRLDQFKYSGTETNTIRTIVTNNKVEAHLKIDDSVEVPVLDIKKTEQGLKFDLKIASSSNSQLRLIRTVDGLDTKMTWDNGNDVRFDILPYERYSVIDPVPGKVYFIPDANCIYLDGKRYGNNLALQTTDTIQVSREGNIYSLDVKVDPDEDNLMFKTEAGLAAKLYWE